MKNILFIFLALISSACGGHKPTLNIELKYQPYVKAFEARSLAAGSNIKVNDLTIQSVPFIADKDTVAICYRAQKSSDSPRIIISQEHWPRLDVQKREELIFHEMGHCVLNREHRSDLNNQVNLSIMKPQGFSGVEYIANYEQYMHELFFQQDLASSLPLLFYTDDPAVNKKMNDLFAQYNGNAAEINTKELDESASSTTILSSEELSHLKCGE